MFKNILKKIVFIFVIIVNIQFNGVFAEEDLRDSIIPETSTITEIGSEVGAGKDEQIGVISQLVNWVKDSIFGILGVITIGMFIYIGFSLVKAQGNPEEMSKAWKKVIHLIIGLFIVAASWALVVMVSGLKI